MGQAWWVTKDEVPKTFPPNVPVLFLQKGTYHFKDRRPSEDGFRFIWRVNGKLQPRPARIDDLRTIQNFHNMGKAAGW